MHLHLHDFDALLARAGGEGFVGFFVCDDGVERAEVADAEEGGFADFRVVGDGDGMAIKYYGLKDAVSLGYLHELQEDAAKESYAG